MPLPLYPTQLDDALCDALVTSQDQRLLFASFWGRDAAIQHLLAGLSLKTSEGGFDCLRVETPTKTWMALLGKDELAKTSGRLPADNLFGDIVQVMVYDQNFAKAQAGSERRQLMLFQSECCPEQRQTELWAAIRHCSHLPLLDHWQTPVTNLLQTNGWLSLLPSFGVQAWLIDLMSEGFELAISHLVRENSLTLDPLPALPQERILAAY